MPGLPANWVRIVADELAELNEEEFGRAWESLGAVVRGLSRVHRAEIALSEAKDKAARDASS
jgi:hypothetical protein